MAGSSSFPLIVFLTLTLFACITAARKNPTDDVQPNIKDFDSGHGNFFFVHVGEGAESKESDGFKRPVKSFDYSRQGNFVTYHGSDGEEPISAAVLKPFMKEFDSKYKTFIVGYQPSAAVKPLVKEDSDSKPKTFVYGYHGIDGVEPTAAVKPLVKGFDSKHENHLLYHGGKGAHEPTE